MSSRRDPVPTLIAWIVAAVSAGYLALLQRRRLAERDVDEAPPSIEDAHEDVSDPSDLRPTTWKFAVTSALRGFTRDQCTDLAAALTYYAVLSLFPALIAIVSLLGVFGQGASTVDAVLEVAGQFVPAATLETIEPVVATMTGSPAAGVGLVLGLLGALWTASGYVGAFGRAMNRIYGVDEGRPVWKLRPFMLVVTFVALVLAALAGLSLVLTGPVAQAVGDVVGIGDTAVQVWAIAKWPALLLVVMTIVAVLYYATPNVQQPRFRWISLGAAVAVVTWILASALFGLYVSMAGNYNATYGSLAGIIVFLLWLWITNIALLLGAELDAELERSRELQAGLAAEEGVLLPPRDTHGIEKQAEKDRDAFARARSLREQHEGADA